MVKLVSALVSIGTVLFGSNSGPQQIETEAKIFYYMPFAICLLSFAFWLNQMVVQ